MPNATTICRASAVSIALLLPLTIANAADLPVKAKPRPIPHVLSWTGFYVGANVGYGWGTKDWTVTAGGPVTPFNINYGIGGALGGVQTGYNFQFDHLVLGIENQWSWTNIGGSGSRTLGPFTNTMGVNVDWFTTLKGRIGFASDRWLIYGAGGGVWARENFTAQLGEVAGTTFAATATRSGWVAGAGVEYALNSNWSVGIAYDYMDLNGSRSRGGSGNGATAQPFLVPPPVVPVPPVVPPGPYTSQISQNIQTIKFTVNYRFGPLTWTPH